MFESILREWRVRRGMSQMTLALAADVSTRHISFLESARARPSAAMVLKLAAALDLPLRERNGLLVAAGFAPHYSDSDWSGLEMAELRQAAQLILAAHSPHPAIVLNAAFDILDANEAALALIGATPAEGSRLNLAELVLATGSVRNAVVNWAEVASYMLHRLQEAARRHGPRSRVAGILSRSLSYPEVASLSWRNDAVHGRIMLPLEFRKGDVVTRWFTTVTSFGGPQDALVEEISIEQFHPVTEINRLPAHG